MEISIIIWLVILVFCAAGVYKFHKDLEFCINEHFKQKRRKDWEALEESFRLEKQMVITNWWNYGRQLEKAKWISYGMTEEKAEEIAKIYDELYKQ